MSNITFVKEVLESLPGIGPSLAEKLSAKIKGKTKSEIIANVRKYNDLPAETIAYIDFNLGRGISRKTADAIVRDMPNWMIPVGSYRRGKQGIFTDLDFITLRPVPEALKYIKDHVAMIVSNGEAKARIVYKQFADNYNYQGKDFVLDKNKNDYIFMDIIYSKKEDLPYALFHWTGNKIFNIRTRAHAKRLGYKLSQYGLFKNNRKIHVENERELFKILGITYKRPEERNE